jgi:hypothetical protein
LSALSRPERETFLRRRGFSDFLRENPLLIIQHFCSTFEQSVTPYFLSKNFQNSGFLFLGMSTLPPGRSKSGNALLKTELVSLGYSFSPL